MRGSLYAKGANFVQIKYPVDICRTVMGESPDCILWSVKIRTMSAGYITILP